MNPLVKPLSHCLLFKNVEEKCILKVLHSLRYNLCAYPKDSTVAIEEDDCYQLGILLEGLLTIQTIYPSGKVLTLTQIHPSDIFGEVVLFSQVHKYPATITARQKSKVLFIEKKAFIDLLSEHPCIMENFISSLSHKLLMLNRKVKTLSLETIRQKICSFLLSEYKKKNTPALQLALSRKDMAEYIGVPRPSLSRELIKMKDEGIIDFKKNVFAIKDLERLEREI
ncbi:MAG: Crp/Fnr family transcriptional regulator [Firmicutes bacterium]|nr:Crp/Fnr family transcriptional regulator [Bacillota bacterium]